MARCRIPILKSALALALLFVIGAAAQPVPASPDYGQDLIIRTLSENSSAWNRWIAGDKEMESRIFRLPMAEARGLLERSLGRYMDILDARRAYIDAVAAYIERSRRQPAANPATLGSVYSDHIAVLGWNMSLLQTRLDSLRGSNEWVEVRRAVQPVRNEAQTLLSSRRSELPLDLSLNRGDRGAEAANAISALVFRDVERQLVETLLKMWTVYYQALIDSAEQMPSKSIPLKAAKAAGDAASKSADAPAQTAPAIGGSVVGVWQYQAGSQQFNGLAEPKEALLEIWVENGALAGRYRAQLTDFDGPKRVDIRLRGSLGAGESPQTLDFESKEPPGRGRITLEPLPSGMELMVVHPAAQGVLPRGRELLRRR